MANQVVESFPGRGTQEFVALNAVAATGAGDNFYLSGARQNFGLQVSWTSNPSTVTVQLEVSNDGVTWTSAGSAFTAASSGLMAFITGCPAAWVRANLTVLTGGTTPHVTALLVAI